MFSTTQRHKKYRKYCFFLPFTFSLLFLICTVFLFNFYSKLFSMNNEKINIMLYNSFSKTYYAVRKFLFFFVMILYMYSTVRDYSRVMKYGETIRWWPKHLMIFGQSPDTTIDPPLCHTWFWQVCCNVFSPLEVTLSEEECTHCSLYYYVCFISQWLLWIPWGEHPSVMIGIRTHTQKTRLNLNTEPWIARPFRFKAR